MKKFLFTVLMVTKQLPRTKKHLPLAAITVFALSLVVLEIATSLKVLNFDQYSNAASQKKNKAALLADEFARMSSGEIRKLFTRKVKDCISDNTGRLEELAIMHRIRNDQKLNKKLLAKILPCLPDLNIIPGAGGGKGEGNVGSGSSSGPTGAGGGSENGGGPGTGGSNNNGSGNSGASGASGATGPSTGGSSPAGNSGSTGSGGTGGTSGSNQITYNNPLVFGAQLSPDANEVSATCPYIKQMGIKATTIWVDWGEFEPQQGVFKWTDPSGTGLDDKIGRFINCGVSDIGLHIEIRNSWGTPASPDPAITTGISMPPTSIQNLNDGLTQLVNHLETAFPGKITRYAIDNEAESNHHWDPETDPAAGVASYFQTLAGAYPALKNAITANNSKALVTESGTGGSAYGLEIGATLLADGLTQNAINYVNDYYGQRPVWGLTPNATDVTSLQNFLNNQTLLTNVRYPQWFGGLFSAQNTPNYDFSQIHFYAPWNDLADVYAMVHDRLKTGGGDKPTEQWEIGYPTLPDYDPAVHAQDTVKLLTTAAGEGSSRVIYWELVDAGTKKGGLSTSPEKDVGLLPCTVTGGTTNANGITTGATVSCSNPNPAGVAFEVTNSKLSGSSTAERIDLPDPAVWVYHFINNGNNIDVIWTDSTETSASVNCSDLSIDPSGSIRITDIGGKDITGSTLSCSSIKVGQSPVFVEYSSGGSFQPTATPAVIGQNNPTPIRTLSNGGPSIGLNQADLFRMYLGLKQFNNKSQAIALAQKSMDDAKADGFNYFRINAGGFCAADFSLWQSNPSAWWQAFDQMVGDLNARNLKLVPSIVWYPYSFPGMSGEPLSKLFDFRTPSKTNQLVKEYTKELVTRYKNNPAILFWELGNELNNRADEDLTVAAAVSGGGGNVCNDSAAGDPNYTTSMMASYVGDLSTYIKSLDPVHFVSSGYSRPRPSSYHRSLCPAWTAQTAGCNSNTADSLTELETWLKIAYPAPVDLMSVHIYPDPKNPYTITDYQTMSLDIGKTLYVGEFGDYDQTTGIWNSNTPFLTQLLSGIVSGKTPYSSAWVWEQYASLNPLTPRPGSLIPGRDDAAITEIQQANRQLGN